MANIVVFGGTGYTGGNIVREAAARGFGVVSISRSAPDEPIDGVQYELGSAEEAAPRFIPAADVVVAALSPRGDMAGRLVEIYSDLAQQAGVAGARYVQIGGFNSLRPAPDQPRFAEGEIPEEYRAEALEGEATRQMLVETAAPDLDWLFVSPPADYGAWVAGERTGNYRVSDEVALLDDNGYSHISGADLAVALLDEIEKPSRAGHISVAY
jgi:hypothetical protein